MKNKILQVTRDSIPYVKSLRLLAGSVTACILMQQLDYWFAKHPEGFFKFLEPCENSAFYKEGDSWTEEIGFSAAEFRTAFDSIGIRYTSKRQYDKAATESTLFQDVKGTQKFYCSYHDKIKGVTYYFRNHALVDSELNKLHLQEINNPELRKSTSSSYVNEESESTEMKNLNLQYKDSETTTETTTETKSHSEAHASARSPVRLIFDYWREKTGHEHAKLTPERERAIRNRLKDYTAEEIMRGVDGCCSSPFHTGQNNSQKRFDDLTLICRNGSKLEDFMALAQSNQPKARAAPVEKVCKLCFGKGEVERMNLDTKENERVECSCRKKIPPTTTPTRTPVTTR